MLYTMFAGRFASTKLAEYNASCVRPHAQIWFLSCPPGHWCRFPTDRYFCAVDTVTPKSGATIVSLSFSMEVSYRSC